jgi:hypothetical protein
MKKKTYKTKDLNSSEVQEPLATYGVPQQMTALKDDCLPDGFMSLDRFGEIFHQKLDACYENIQSNSQ